MISKYLNNVRSKKPLVHNITNYVTANDCANILIACGSSPIMSDCIDEVEEITSVCNGLNINIGTPDRNTAVSMLAAGKKSNSLSHPVVLDPVGVSVSEFRKDIVNRLLDEVNLSVIKGNITEIKTLALGLESTKGVDADTADKVTEENLCEVISFAKAFSKKTGAVIVITGETDIIANDAKACVVKNGHPMMSEITGSGCMLSSLITAFISANHVDVFMSTLAAVC